MYASTPNMPSYALVKSLLVWTTIWIIFPGCDDTDHSKNPTVDACSTEGETTCIDEASYAVCELNGEVLDWSTPVSCEPGYLCLDGACAPDPVAEEHLALVEEFVDAIIENSAWLDDFPVDKQQILEQAWQTITSGGATDRVLYKALRGAMLAHPVGHQALFASMEICLSEDMFWQAASRLGVCGRPFGDEIAITHVLPGNPLGLEPGDVVTGVDGLTGDAMFEEVLRYPMCGYGSAGDYNRRITAATSLFGSIPVGTEVTIRYSDGTVDEITIPEATVTYLDCRDPVGRDTYFNAQASVREDGIGVIQLPRLFPIDSSFDDPYEELFNEMMTSVLEAFELVKDAPALIWDIRANTGGITPVAFDIVEGMPGAQAGFIARIEHRIPGSDPLAFSPNGSGDYVLSPSAEEDLAYEGAVAVLADGLAGSAADYLIRAVHLYTDVPVVGTPAAGAFGGTGASVLLDSEKELTGYLDPWRCSDESGAPLEGSPSEPDLFVELDPVDLADGIDSQLEAAAALLLEELNI